MIPRNLLIALLAFGTVGGFASGFASLSYRLRGGCHAAADHGHARWRHAGPTPEHSTGGSSTVAPPPPIHVNVTVNPQ